MNNSWQRRLVEETGRTVREVLADWHRTVRLSALVMVAAIAWTICHVHI
jgi:hypothetical protein